MKRVALAFAIVLLGIAAAAMTVGLSFNPSDPGPAFGVTVGLAAVAVLLPLIMVGSSEENGQPEHLEDYFEIEELLYLEGTAAEAAQLYEEYYVPQIVAPLRDLEQAIRKVRQLLEGRRDAEFVG